VLRAEELERLLAACAGTSFEDRRGTEGDLTRLADWKSREMLSRYGASAADERARGISKKMPLRRRFRLNDAGKARRSVIRPLSPNRAGAGVRREGCLLLRHLPQSGPYHQIRGVETAHTMARCGVLQY
jgi:hypothetical protein